MANKGWEVKECQGCTIVDRVAMRITSCIHEHPAARSVQKKIKVSATFTDLETGKPVEVCENCQGLLMSGMVSGKNWDTK